MPGNSVGAAEIPYLGRSLVPTPSARQSTGSRYFAATRTAHQETAQTAATPPGGEFSSLRAGRQLGRYPSMLGAASLRIS